MIAQLKPCMNLKTAQRKYNKKARNWAQQTKQIEPSKLIIRGRLAGLAFSTIDQRH